MKHKIFLIMSICCNVLLSASLFAGTPAIISMTMNPTNPDWGQQFVLTMQVCHDAYNSENDLVVAVSTSNVYNPAPTGGQIFLISSQGVDAHSANPKCQNGQLAYNGCDMGYTLPVPNPTPVLNCDTCTNGGGFDGYTQNLQFNLTMPQSSDMGTACGSTTLYLLAATKSSGLSSTDWTGTSAGVCNNSEGADLSWPLPTPPPGSLSIDKRATGMLQDTGDLVLFSIDYTYGNGQLVITDPLPGVAGLTLVSVGPSTISGGNVTAPAAGSSSGNIVWTLPASTYTKQGTVWILMQMSTLLSPGTQITNTASATCGANNASASANITVGSAAISVQKLESVSSFLKLTGDNATITYFLNYTVNGDRLRAYRSFDNTTTQTYTSGTGAPPGWIFEPSGSDYGTWTVSDPCGTGDRTLTGAAQGSSYPALLMDDPTPANVDICTGIVACDVYINPDATPPNGYQGADGLVILRNNNQGGNSNAYALLLSIDTNPAGGYVGFQKCAGSSCNWYAGETTFPISGDTWYHTKTWMTTDAGGDYIFNAKVWQFGSPEPSGYTASWTDAGAANNAAWNCSGTGTYNDWRPGVGEQSGGSAGAVQDSYDNMAIMTSGVSASAVLYDTIPAGLNYSGSNPAGTTTGGSPNMVTWALNNLADQSGSYTWWATTNACGQSFTNVAGIAAPGVVAQFSNPVVFDVNCMSPTPQGSPTDTPTITSTITPTYTDSPVYSPTNSPTYTATPSITPTYSPTSTYTNTATVTMTTTPLPAMPTMVLEAVDVSVLPGGTAQLSITITNIGSQAQNVIIWDTVPQNSTFPTNNSSNAGWTLTGNTFSYNVGTVAAGASITINFAIQTSSSLTTGDSVTVGGLSGTYFDPLYNKNNTFSSGTATIAVGNIVVYPNPYNPLTAVGGTLKFANVPTDAQILIFTVSGEIVKSFRERSAIVYWNGTNEYNINVSPGIYYFTITWNNNNSTMTGKIFLVRN